MQAVQAALAPGGAETAALYHALPQLSRFFTELLGDGNFKVACAALDAVSTLAGRVGLALAPHAR